MLEVCVDSLSGAALAIAGGADHIELCSSLSEGGLTPSAGLLHVVKQEVNKTNVKINVMIRCRAGSDFCYSANEIQTMLADVEILKNIGADAFVFGALTKERKIDIENCAKIIEKASPLPVTFHRAFDVCDDPLSNLEHIIQLGFSKILTSGQMNSACDPKAVKNISKFVEKSNFRIIIMAGAGITENNVQALAETGVLYFHSSCKAPKIIPSKDLPAMGTGVEKIIYEADMEKVMKLKDRIRSM